MERISDVIRGLRKIGPVQYQEIIKGFVTGSHSHGKRFPTTTKTKYTAQYFVRDFQAMNKLALKKAALH